MSESSGLRNWRVPGRIRTCEARVVSDVGGKREGAWGTLWWGMLGG